MNLISFEHLSMYILQLLKYLGVDITGIRGHKHLELLADHKDDLALIDNRV